ncbi:hypothetical protein ZIOFF_060646 [Zingiber officinale]|uniref:DUF4283 domain-containing protein n=1 Tax=Zingiber officinale TaxID=94328 RepID=A0A8J5FGW2_ZINOF|nr:hypothetical protein ZIOFF_060646 [Zingiber officinale]
MRIFKWSLKFSYEVESSVVLVCIQFPDLPIYMFYKKGLFAAANIVGRPLKVDEATTDGSRLIMARVCVEIDLLKQRLKISRLHLGHSAEECYGKGYHPNPYWGVGKQNFATMGEDPRDLKEDKHLVGIPKRGEEAHPGESENSASSEEEEDVGGLDISKSFVEMEDLDNLVIKKGSSSLKDESGGGADRQGQLGI